MSELKFWWGSGSPPCFKVMFVLEEKKLPYTSNLIEFSKKEHKSDEIIKINPRGQVPTFTDGDVVVNESNAICQYLCEKYPEKGTRLLPENVDQRAAVYQRMAELSNLESAARPIFMYRMKTKKEEWDEAHIKELYSKLEEEIERWEKYLTGKSYLCGNALSMADVFLYVNLAQMVRQGSVLDKKYPALNAFYKLVDQREAADKSKPPHWKGSESPGYMLGIGV